MTHNWLRLLVPRDWTGDQALDAVSLLQQAIDAVWFVHGEEMAFTLGELGPSSDIWAEVLPEPPDLYDDDIPF